VQNFVQVNLKKDENMLEGAKNKTNKQTKKQTKKNPKPSVI